MLSLIGACEDERASPPSNVIRSVRSADGGDQDSGARSDGAAGASGAQRDAGRKPLDFGDFEVDESPAPARDAGDATPDGGAPADWRCDAALASDAVCDCGCGAADPACDGRGCSAPGCSVPACGGCFDGAGEARDCRAPGSWQCEAARRADGVCDCGCGALDPDCEAGAGCFPLGCNVDGCERCQSARGSADCETPAEFVCGDAARENGKCDCGCGNIDPECVATVGCSEPGCSVLGCELCHGDDGSLQACAAPGAACGIERTRDGVCDCGCGEPDPECGGAGCSEPGCEAEACEVRRGEDGKPIQPEAFACGDEAFGDAVCDCGCGAADPACVKGCTEPGCRAAGCDRCRGEEGEPEACRWLCDAARFGDGQCDCGCGALDPDCDGGGCEKPGCFADACEVCVGEGGASIGCERSACPPDFQNDGVCDCGCREDDVDCSFARDCIAPGCSERGCGRCHDEAGLVIQCADFVCAFGAQGNGGDCNCGCGAPDPDCAAGAGCSGPGCVADGCVTCQAADGAPMSCAP